MDLLGVLGNGVEVNIDRLIFVVGILKWKNYWIVKYLVVRKLIVFNDNWEFWNGFFWEL